MLTHEASQAFITTVDAVYRRLRGRPITWGQFVEELITRLKDPRGIVIAALMSAIHTGAQYHYGAPRGIQVNGPGGQSTEIDMLRTRTIIEDKSARGLAQPGRSPARWADLKIFEATVRHLALLGVRSVATKPGTPTGTTTRAQPAYGTPKVPPIAEVLSAAQGRSYQFRIEADTPALRAAVELQLQRLRALYPGWRFTALFGTGA